MNNSYNNLEKLNASAGSGKTFTLTNRFVDLLFDSDIAPCESCRPYNKNRKYNFSELLAITFTNLAANQMKEKVIRILKEYAFEQYPCSNEQEKKKKSKQAHAMLEAIFQQYGALNIRTIDSLLNQLFGLFALELGYSPHFKTTFGAEKSTAELYYNIAAESIKNGYCAEDFRELCHNTFYGSEYEGFFAKETLAESVFDFVKYSIENNHYFSKLEIEEAENNYHFFQTECEEVPKRIQICLDTLLMHISQNSISVHSNALKAFEKAKQGAFSSTYLKKESFDGVLLKSNKADTTKVNMLYGELKSVIEQQECATFLRNAYCLALSSMKIGAYINRVLPFYEKELQQVNTQKMAFIIAAILGRGNDELCTDFLLHKKQEEVLLSAAFCRLGTRLRHILYDEFQDTSIAQWQALKDLSSEALAGGGSVLFVGDVKQAIYGWRGGKAELFDDAPKELSCGHWNIYEDNLKYNWRSFGNIIEWNNAFFELLSKSDNEQVIRLAEYLSLLFPITQRETLPLQLCLDTVHVLRQDYAFVRQEIPVEKKKKVEHKGTVQVHSLHVDEEFFNLAVLSLLPEMVKNLLKRHKEYKNITVLTVNNEQASMVSQILQLHGIPVVSQGSLGLKEHPIIAELIGFLRFLANPLDDNAFCQVLMSKYILPQPFAHVCSQEQIEEFFVQIRKTSCHTAFKEKFPKIWQEYFYDLVDGTDLVTAYDMICEVYNRMAVMDKNPEASVYLLRFRELAHLAEENGIVDLRSFLEWWDENGEKEKAPLPEGVNSVSVMTIHKSKGLEFDAVIIPWHNFRIEAPKGIHELNIFYDDKPYKLFSKLKAEFGMPYYQGVMEKIRESINVVYVGWTRAKKELQIFMPALLDERKKGAGYFYRFLNAMFVEMEEKLSVQNELIFEKNEYCFHAGERIDPVFTIENRELLESILSADALLDEGEAKSDNKRKNNTREERRIKSKNSVFNIKQKKIERILDEYTDEKGNIAIQKKELLYAAKAISCVLSPFKDVQKKNLLVSTEKEFVQAHSMDWLPQLRIFRTDLNELLGQKDLSSNKRGTFIHKSLECLVLSGNLQEDCRRACAEAMKTLPYGRFAEVEELRGNRDIFNNNRKLYIDTQEKLFWFASLTEPFGGAQLWLQNGYREHGITDEKGNMFRVDLLVEIPEALRRKYDNIAYVAVDYKTGYMRQDLPIPANKDQISNYIRLLEDATGRKTVGLLIYLDVQKCCLIER